MNTQYDWPPSLATGPLDRYMMVRTFSEGLCRTLETEDYVVQSMPDVSPTKWHLAHTTWFFETFVLEPHLPNYTPFDPAFRVLFNSYYNAVGKRHARPQRGNLTRPTVAQTFAYRVAVDDRMCELISGAPGEEILQLVEIGLHHEQQHQELMLTDIKHVFSMNPLAPIYRPRLSFPKWPEVQHARWVCFDEGIRTIGHRGEGFHFDNEGPAHTELIHGFALGSRLITNGEYLEFMADGGYAQPSLWLSDGWNAVQTYGWDAPLYWSRADDGSWQNFTLSGLRPVAPDEPVTHVSYYESDAFARWAGARLATEAEWETAAASAPISGNFVESGAFHPLPILPQTPSEAEGELTNPSRFGEGRRSRRDAPGRGSQLYGDVWEWTGSAYLPYPGYRPAPGALGEYNGKFMCNQFVLRGGSCATSVTHIRPTYRNFFPPDARWQFSGIRLAKDA